MSGTVDPNFNTSTPTIIVPALSVLGPATGVTVTEDGASGVFDRAALLAQATETDPSATLSIAIDDLHLPPSVVYNHVAGFTTVSTVSYYGFTQIVTVPTVDTLTIDPADPAYQSLAAGEEIDVVVKYSITDGTNVIPTQAIFHVIGTNDAPVVSGPVAGAALEGGAPVTVSGLGRATDVDHGAVLTVVAAPPPAAEAENFINAAGVAEGAAPPPPPILPFDPTSLPAGVTFDATTNSFSFDPTNPAYRSLAAGQTQTVTVNYGVSDGAIATAASVVFTVTGVNDAPVVSGPVTGVTVSEGGASGGYALANLLATSSDPDPGDRLRVQIDDTRLPDGVHHVSTPDTFVPDQFVPTVVIPAVTQPGVTWGGYVALPVVVQPAVVIPAHTIPAHVVPGTDNLTIDPTDPVFDHLAQGESMDVTVNYLVSDGILTTSAQAVFHVVGTNDAPVVASPSHALATEGGVKVTVSALANASDVDDGVILRVVNDPNLPAPAPVAINPAVAQAEAEAEAEAAAAGVSIPLPRGLFALDPSTLPAGVTFDSVNQTFTLDPADPAYLSLAAGQTKTVTVNYGVSDGIAVTSASVVFTVTGVNDAPVVSGPATGVTVTEDGLPGAYDRLALLANASDPDTGDQLSVVVDETQLPDGVTYNHVAGQVGVTVTTASYYGATWTYTTVVDTRVDTLTLDASNAAFQSLAQGETEDVVVNYGVSDGTVVAPAQAIFHVVGTNDAPVVAGTVTGAATEDGAAVTIGALAQATDVDHGAVLHVVAAPTVPGEIEVSGAGIPETPPLPILPFDPSTLPAGVTYDAAAQSFTIDPTNAAYQSLAAGQTMTVGIDYGVSDGMAVTKAHAEFVVTGTNDAPEVSGPVTFAVTARNATASVTAPPAATTPDDSQHQETVQQLEAAGVSATLAVNSIDMLAHASDVDQGTTLQVVGLPTILPSGITHYTTAPYYTPSTVYYGAPTFHPGIEALRIDPTDPSFKALAAGETELIEVDYGVTDGITTTQASAIFIVTGINDAPVVTGPLAIAATEDGAVVTVGARGNATDPDHGAVLTATDIPTVLPAGVSFDAASQTFSIDPSVAAYQYLSVGQTTQVSVAYSISDGMVSTPAMAVFTITGTNDAPILTGPQSVAAVEDAPAFAINPFANASDIDQRDVLAVVGPLGDGIVRTATGYAFNPGAAAFQSLAQGEIGTFVWNYGISDGTVTVPTSMTFTVTGINDAPTVPSPRATGTEDGAVVRIDALSTATDPDHGSTLSVVNVQPSLPAGISYDAATHSFSLDPTNAAFQSLGQGQIGTYTVSYGVTDGIATTAANAIFSVVGVNDAPVIVAPIVGSANEDGARSNIEPLLNVTDIDSPLDALRIVNIPAVLPAGVTFDSTTASHQKFILDPTNAAYQYLSVGETTTVTISFGISDGYVTVPTTATWTITGTNDAPVVSGAVSGGTVASSSGIVSLNLLANASDVDHLDVLNASGLTATVTSGTWSSPVTFSVVNNQLAVDTSQFAHLALGSSLGLTFNYQVSDGHPGGTVAGTANLSIQGTYVPPPPPTGISVSPVPGQVAKAQGGGGINAKVAIATINQVGGSTADSFNYSLSGTGAGTAFTLATSNGVATLSSGNSGATGAAGGALYALNVTATDMTTGLSSPASAVDVVVGLGKGSNTINLASIPGIVSSAPTFIDDLGGADVINASGMTGKLFFSSGQGADTMTGGSGPNDYLYGATTDSSLTAMDIITNFHAAIDLLDFTGLGGKSMTVGALASNATSIAANAIGWQTSGGNTFVYVNTSGNSAALSASSMKIELMGSVPLTANNIAHL